MKKISEKLALASYFQKVDIDNTKTYQLSGWIKTN